MDKKKHIVHISAMVVREDKKFLIIRRLATEVSHPGTWTVPGGKAEDDEWVLEVLKREVKEEAGLDIEDRYDFLWDYAFRRPDGHSVKGFCFRVWPKPGEVKPEDGRQDYAWISVEDVDRYEFAEGMADRLKKSAWKWLERPGK
jgi:8-oxo-dGTP pyrophosphatase MutT (NUDIX family)